MKIFDRAVIEEYLRPGRFSKSTTSTYRSVIRRFGECIEAEHGNEAIAWSRFADTRKHSDTPQPSHKVIQSGKVVMKNYMWWVKSVYPVYYDEYKAFLHNAPVNPSRPKVDEIDFDAIISWLESQSEFFHTQRNLGVDEIVKYASDPVCSEFEDAIKRVQDTDSMLKLLTDLTTIVEIVKEA